MAAESPAAVKLERLFTHLLRTDVSARETTIKRAFATPPGVAVTKWWTNNSADGWSLLLRMCLEERTPTSVVALLLTDEYVELRDALTTLVTLPAFRPAEPHHRAMFDLLLSHTADESPSDLAKCAAKCADASCRDAILKRLSQPSRSMAAKLAVIGAIAQAREKAEKRKRKDQSAATAASSELEETGDLKDADDEDTQEEDEPSRPTRKKPASGWSVSIRP